MNFKVIYSEVNKRDRCPMITIETSTIQEKDSFSYSSIYGMYKTASTQEHGIQVNNSKIEKSLMKMCNTISQAVYDYKMETTK